MLVFERLRNCSLPGPSPAGSLSWLCAGQGSDGPSCAVMMVLLESGMTAPADLTIAVDMATRTICAAALHMSASRLPHAPLLDIDARMEMMAAKPVIVPDTIVIDGEGVRLRHVHPRLRPAGYLGAGLPSCDPNGPQRTRASSRRHLTPPIRCSAGTWPVTPGPTRSFAGTG